MFPHIIHYYRQEEEIYEMYSLLPTTVTIIKKSTVNAGEGSVKREPSSASAGNVEIATDTEEHRMEVP